MKTTENEKEKILTPSEEKKRERREEATARVRRNARKVMECLSMTAQMPDEAMRATLRCVFAYQMDGIAVDGRMGESAEMADRIVESLATIIRAAAEIDLIDHDVFTGESGKFEEVSQKIHAVKEKARRLEEMGRACAEK